MSVGRNDPCPCGSGKKFKQCCQGKSLGAALPASNGSASKDAQHLAALKRKAQEFFAAGRFREAAVPLAEIARLRPESAEAHYDLGAAYVRSGHYVAAAESLRKAVKLRPGFRDALVQLAQALEYHAAEPEAAAIYGKLSRSAPDAEQRLYYTAKAEILQGRLEPATASLRRLLTVRPGNGHARHLLGQVLIDRREFDEAARELRLALESHPAAFQKLAAATRITDADRPLLLRMRSMIVEGRLDAQTRALVLYGLGKAYDDLGDYEDAIGCYDAANALRRAHTRFDREALARRYDDVIARYGAASLRELFETIARKSVKSAELPILIVGLPRSGTTLVEQILSSHPRVAAAGELQYWRVRDLEIEREHDAWRDRSVLRRAGDDYLTALREIGPSALRVTDKAPLNFEALGLIMSALPECRVIHCRRQPIDTCLSIYFTEFSGSLGFAFDRGDIAYFYRQYSRLMEHWRHVLPPDRFLEVDYENLVTDPGVVTRRIIAFAGLPWDASCLAPERNDRVVRTASLWQVRQPIYQTPVERWRRYEPWLGELRELASKSIGDGGG